MKPGKIVLIVFGLTVLSLFSSYIKKILDYIFGKRCITYDGIEICVKSDDFTEEKKYLLKILAINLKKLIVNLKTLERNNANIKRFFQKIGDKGITKIEETTEDYDYGEKNINVLKLCLGKRKNIEYSEDIIDLNSLTYVALHKFAHIMTKRGEHTKEFIDNWKFLIEQAKNLKIYISENYKNGKKTYCNEQLANP